MTVKVSPKYQVVIPESVRRALHIRPGTKIDVIAKGNVAYLVPVVDLAHVQKRLKGRVDQKNVREKKDRII